MECVDWNKVLGGVAYMGKASHSVMECVDWNANVIKEPGNDAIVALCNGVRGLKYDYAQ